MEQSVVHYSGTPLGIPRVVEEKTSLTHRFSPGTGRVITARFAVHPHALNPLIREMSRRGGPYPPELTRMFSVLEKELHAGHPLTTGAPYLAMHHEEQNHPDGPYVLFELRLHHPFTPEAQQALRKERFNTHLTDAQTRRAAAICERFFRIYTRRYGQIIAGLNRDSKHG